MANNNKNFKKNNGGNSKNSGGNKGKGSGRSQNYKNSRSSSIDSINDGRNDASWYKVDNQLLKDAARASFNNALGMTVSGVVDTDSFHFPGVAAIVYAPTIGEATEANSASNIAAKRLMAFLRSKVSTKLGFSAADAMMYLLALDGMYSFHSYCVRLYGLHRSYISINRYYPDTLFKAMGLKVDSTTDWNEFRTWLNRWSYKLSQLYIPSAITYFDRHKWMNSNVYFDAPDPKAQSFIFVPSALYKWDGTTNPNGTQLVLTPLPVQPNENGIPGGTLAQLQAFGDSLLENLLQDLDISELSGLILRAYGEGSCRKMETVAEDYMLAPVFNAEVLNQVHNATICGPIDKVSSGTITQTEYDTLAVSYSTVVDSNVVLRHLSKNVLIDLPMQNPTEDDLFVATRLIARGLVDEVTGSAAELTNYGTEVVEKIIIYGRTAINIISSSCITASSGGSDDLVQVAKASAFSSFPILFAARMQSGEMTSDIIDDVISNIANYTVLTDSELEKIHSAAALSLFSIPVVG